MAFSESRAQTVVFGRTVLALEMENATHGGSGLWECGSRGFLHRPSDWSLEEAVFRPRPHPLTPLEAMQGEGADGEVVVCFLLSKGRPAQRSSPPTGTASSDFRAARSTWPVIKGRSWSLPEVAFGSPREPGSPTSPSGGSGPVWTATRGPCGRRVIFHRLRAAPGDRSDPETGGELLDKGR